MKRVVINRNEEGQTIFKYVKKYLEGAPLSFIEKLFRVRDVKINKKRVSKNEIIHTDDVVEIYITDNQYNDFMKEKEAPVFKNFPKVVFEDENILIVNKPSGLLVHGDAKEKRITLTNMVLSYLASKGEYDPSSSTFTPALAHRIDRNTSGLVIFGKNILALQALEDLFKEHNLIHKYYYALISGHIAKEGTIDKPLLKDETNSLVKVVPIEKGGKRAITKYRLKETYSYCSLVDVNILTGRTHQIRVHFASINHPLLGDKKYGDFALNKKFDKDFNYKGQFLHAYKLEFDQIEGYLSYLSNQVFTCELGKKENEILETLRKNKR